MLRFGGVEKAYEKGKGVTVLFETYGAYKLARQVLGAGCGNERYYYGK